MRFASSVFAHGYSSIGADFGAGCTPTVTVIGAFADNPPSTASPCNSFIRSIGPTTSMSCEASQCTRAVAALRSCSLAVGAISTITPVAVRGDQMILAKWTSQPAVQSASFLYPRDTSIPSANRHASRSPIHVRKFTLSPANDFVAAARERCCLPVNILQATSFSIRAASNRVFADSCARRASNTISTANDTTKIAKPTLGVRGFQPFFLKSLQCSHPSSTTPITTPTAARIIPRSFQVISTDCNSASASQFKRAQQNAVFLRKVAIFQIVANVCSTPTGRGGAIRRSGRSTPSPF